MLRYIHDSRNNDYLSRIKTDFVVLARCTFVYTNVISLPSPCSREKGAASELGSLAIKDFCHGT
jgi:hypothetical protein